MAVNENKIYEIKLNITGSGVTPTDNLRLQLSGSNSANFVDVSISGSVTEWQSGREISGSTLITAYEEAVDVIEQTVFAARLRNESGVCTGQISNPFSFIIEQTCFDVILEYKETTPVGGCIFVGQETTYYMDAPNFSEATRLFLDDQCTPQPPLDNEPTGYAPEGFYHTNGGIYREVTGNGILGTPENC